MFKKNKDEKENRRRIHFNLSDGWFTDHGIQTLILAAIIVLFSLGSLIVPDRSFSETENRTLSSRPKIGLNSLLDGSFTENLEEYYADQFLLRDQWVGLNSLGDRLAGKREKNGVLIGKKGYLLGEAAEPDWIRMTELAETINTFSESSRADVYMMTVPNAASIMPEKLPSGAPTRDQAQDVKTFNEKLSATIRIIDAEALLSPHKDEYIFYKTDHHWTSLGAKYAFDGVSEAMNIEDLAADYDIYTVSNKFKGTLSSKVGGTGSKDSINIYSPKGKDIVYYVNFSSGEDRATSIFKSQALKQKNQYEVFLGGNYPKVEIRTSSLSDRNLLLIKDSYANSMVQFLYPYFGSIIMVDPRYNYDSIGTLLSTEGITDVLILYSADTLFTDTSLLDYLVLS